MNRCLSFVFTLVLLLGAPLAGHAQEEAKKDEQPACSLTNVQNWPLVVGASMALEVTVASRCRSALKKRDGETVILRGGTDIKATLQKTQSAEKFLLLFQPVPDLSPGVFDYQVLQDSAGNPALGKIRLRVQTLLADKRLVVRYQKARLNPYHSGLSSVGPSEQTIASVNLAMKSKRSGATEKPDKHDDGQANELVNIATLGSLGAALADFRWTITPPARVAVWCPKTTEANSSGGWKVGTACLLPGSLDRMEFAVAGEASPGPIRLLVRLAPEQKELDKTKTKAADRGFLEHSVVLASEARAESLPLPLARSMHVGCGDRNLANTVGVDPVRVRQYQSETDRDRAFHAETQAIDDRALREGLCRLYIDHVKVDDKKTVRRLYGTQALSITLRRLDTDKQAHDTWCVSLDSDKDRKLSAYPIPIISGDTGSEGIYEVTVKPVSAASCSINYRDGAFELRNGTEFPRNPEAVFRTRLRPRGPFGLPSIAGFKLRGRELSVRLFVTIPVTVAGLRAPAVPRDLRASTDSPYAQLVTLQSGVLGALEPWDYNLGRNPWVIPVRLLVGSYFLDLGKADFLPSFVAGVAFTLPLIDKPSSFTDTSLAIGLFYELDVRNGTHSHFLLTFGFNVLSLFSPNQGEKK